MRPLTALLAALVTLLGCTSAAIAELPAVGRETHHWTLVSSTCTDAFDTPATTANVDLTTLTNWDTFAEAVNPLQNIGDAPQVSGSADGWCDSEPWKLSGAITTTANPQDLYVGPIPIARAGMMTNIEVTTSAGSAIVVDGLTVTGHQFVASAGYSATIDALDAVFLGIQELSSDINGNWAPLPAGPIYLRLSFSGLTGAWVVGVQFIPIRDESGPRG